LAVKVLYVSGKYRDPRGPWYVRKHIELAADVALELWLLGCCAICPHQNSMYFEGPLSDPIIIEGDRELVRRSDGLVVCPNWETSVGTAEEWKVAWEGNKPIFYWQKPHHRMALRRWLAGDYDIGQHVERQRGADSIARLYELDPY
jgi:hypothetical protein